jgi:hypothetical protein
VLSRVAVPAQPDDNVAMLEPRARIVAREITDSFM